VYSFHLPSQPTFKHCPQLPLNQQIKCIDCICTNSSLVVYDTNMATESTTDIPTEVGAEEPVNNEQDAQPKEASNEECIAFGVKEEIVLGMSSRASTMKEYLLTQPQVSCILLKADGTSEEIQSSVSSQDIRTLLAGKATVIGEIEELQVVVVRALIPWTPSQTANTHQLPVPLCQCKYPGDYLLYRMDTAGKPLDLSLKEYTKYIEDHKTLTATAIKNHTIDSVQIKAQSPFGSRAQEVRVQLMGQIEAQIRGDTDTKTENVENTKDTKDTEISKAVEQVLQDSIDETVAEWKSSPMEDPDYQPEETPSAQSTPSQEPQADQEEEEESKVEELDERSWRDQLNDALQHVRQIGMMDGQVFAQRLSETFFDLNGEEPSQNQMRSVFSKIKNEFASEAEEERNDEMPGNETVEEAQTLDDIEEDEDEEDVESEETDNPDDVVMEEPDEVSPLEKLEMATETIGNDWISRAESLWMNTKGREPTERELAQTVKQLAQEFADSVLDIAMETAERDTDTEEEEEEDDSEQEAEEQDAEKMSDADYDPDNVDDVEMEEIDATENRKHDKLHFDDWVLTTPMVSAKRGGGVSWNMYFDEEELNEKVESANVEQATQLFKTINKRDPSNVEMHKMKQFLSVPNEVADEMDDSNVVTSQIVESTKGGGAAWTIVEGADISSRRATRNLEKAVAGFKTRNSREPTSAELEDIKKFMTASLAMDNEEEKVSRSPSKVLVTPVKRKENSVRLNVYLEGNRYSEEESEKLALQCFKKFNKRDPSEEELTKIRAFVKADTDLKEQVYLVSAKGTDDAVLDDEKEMDIPIQSATTGMVTKKAATGYLLDFEEETKRVYGDEKMATKWFKRFNNRDPDEEELEQLKQFVQAKEEEAMIDID